MAIRVYVSSWLMVLILINCSIRLVKSLSASEDPAALAASYKAHYNALKAEPGLFNKAMTGIELVCDLIVILIAWFPFPCQLNRTLGKLLKKGSSASDLKKVAQQYIRVLTGFKMPKAKILDVLRYMNDVFALGRKKLNFNRIQCGQYHIFYSIVKIMYKLTNDQLFSFLIKLNYNRRCRWRTWRIHVIKNHHCERMLYGFYSINLSM